jgi:hypothetical protein
MRSKGHSPVNPAAEGVPAADGAREPGVASPTRRHLLGASVLGAALAVAAGRTVSASSSPATSANGSGLTDDDVELLRFAIGLELAARDLYDAAIAAGADPGLLEVMSEQHEAYAQGIAGLTGLSASERNDEVFDALSGDFETSDLTAVATAAYDLESAAAATHGELLGLLESVDAAKLVASIAAVEARHCTVLADVSGNGDDLDALLVNTAEPILPA